MGCAKIAYRTPRRAQQAARRVAVAVGHPLRVYRCPDCGAWHLTRQLRRWQEGRMREQPGLRSRHRATTRDEAVALAEQLRAQHTEED